MSAEPKRPHSRIRTFAQDLEEERQKRGEQPTPDSSPAPDSPTPEPVAKKKVKPEPAPQAKAASDIPDAPRIQEPEKKEKPVKPVPVPQAQAAVDTKPIKREPIEKPKPSAPIPQPPKSTAGAPAKIPAFHELQKQVESISKSQDFGTPPKRKPSPSNANKQTGDDAPLRGVNIGYDATVITDTKRKRFRLFPSIGASLKKWFGNLTKSKKKATPKYSVPDADRRKGVIQKATSKSGSVFTADNDTLREQIKHRRQESEEAKRQAEAEAKLKREQAEAEPETSWSPYTEAGYALLEEHDETASPKGNATKNVTIEFKKQTPLPVTTTPATADVAKPLPKPVAPEPSAPPEPSEKTPEPARNPPNPEPVAPASPTPPPNPEPVPTESQDTQPQQPPTAEEVGDEAPIDLRDTNTLTLVIFGGIAVIAIITLVTVSLMRDGDSQPNRATDQPFQTQTLIGAQTERLDYTPSADLTASIVAKSNTNPLGLIDVQIYSADGTVLQPNAVIDRLDLSLLPSFRQTISDIRFATINQSDPILVINFTDEASARGGFLAWERTMASDLVGFYDLSTNSSLDFTDAAIRGIDVRVMRSLEGETLIVYGIVNENTAIITNSVEDFTQVLQTSFSQ